MTAILLALVLTQAQPKLASSGWHWVEPKDYSAPVFDYCRNGGDCRVRDLTVASTLTISPGDGAGTVAMTIPNFHYTFYGNSCWTYANGAQFIVANSSCQTSLNGQVLIGSWLRLASQVGSRVSFGTPASYALGLQLESNTGDIFLSDASRWRRMNVGDEVDNGVTYCYGWNDATPGWQTGGTLSTDSFGAVAATETCASGTIANTTANQTLPTKTTKVRTYQTQDAVNAQCNRVFTHVFTWANSLPIISFRAGLSQTTYVRARIGWAKNTVFTTSDDAPADNGAWFRYSTNAGDTNFMACTGDGTTTSCTSTGVAADTAIHLFEIDMAESTSVVTFSVDGRARVRATTNVPSSGATLSFGHDVTELALPDAGISGAKTMSVGLWCVRR